MVPKVIIERDAQGGYVAIFPELLGRRTRAASLKTLMERIRETTAPDPEPDAPLPAPSKLSGISPNSP
jgi:dienelactone hydrolase